MELNVDLITKELDACLLSKDEMNEDLDKMSDPFNWQLETM